MSEYNPKRDMKHTLKGSSAHRAVLLDDEEKKNYVQEVKDMSLEEKEIIDSGEKHLGDIGSGLLGGFGTEGFGVISDKEAEKRERK